MNRRRWRAHCLAVAGTTAFAFASLGLDGCSRTPSTAQQDGSGGDADAVLVSYERVGGSAPTDAESLDVTVAGQFSLRRTTGGTRIGHFAGKLPDKRLRSLQAATRAISEAAVPTGPIASESRIELVAVSEISGTFRGNQTPSKRWSKLLDLLRHEVGALTDQPVAALELVVHANGPDGQLSGELRQVGPEAVRLAGGPIKINLSIFDRTNVLNGTWATSDKLEPSDVGPGWILDLRLDRSDTSARPGDSRIVAVELSVIHADGLIRLSRLAVQG